MTTQEFLTEMEDVLQRDEPIAATDVLRDMEEWDSLSKMATMAFFKKHFDIAISLDEISKFESVSDLIKLAGDKIQ